MSYGLLRELIANGRYHEGDLAVVPDNAILVSVHARRPGWTPIDPVLERAAGPRSKQLEETVLNQLNRLRLCHAAGLTGMPDARSQHDMLPSCSHFANQQHVLQRLSSGFAGFHAICGFSGRFLLRFTFSDLNDCLAGEFMEC